MRHALPLLIALLATGCAEQPRVPDLTAIYAEAARQGAETRRPLIAVPGILGSRLVDDATGTVVWGGGPDGPGISAPPDTPEGARLIALPIGGRGEALADLRDRVRAESVVNTLYAEVLGLPVDIDVYAGVVRTLTAGGFRVGEAGPGTEDGPADFDGFQFAYDWRRDIVESAQALDRFIASRGEAVRARPGRPPGPVTFDIISHSMGALVVRYYLMYGGAGLPADGSLPELTWAGAANIERVVFVAPPNAGSVLSLDNLVNGKDIGPFQPVYPPGLLATFPSLYELMPRVRHDRVYLDSLDGPPVGDLYDAAFWDRMGWGLMDPSQAELLAWLMPGEPDPARRRARALAYLGDMLARAEQFQRAMDRAWDVPPPPGLDLYLVVGSGFRTPADAVVDNATGAFAIAGFEEGDGVVTRASALLDERQGQDYEPQLASPLAFRSILFLPEEHVALPRSPVFGDNLLFWLLEAPRPDTMLAEPGRSDLLGGRAPADAAIREPETPD